MSVFERSFAQRLPVLLKGPTGCGKSRFVEFMAERLDRPLITVACNDETSAADLVGRWLVRGGDTVWQDGPATRAVRQGGILYLDEVAEAREDVVVLLHPLTDHRRQLFLDRNDEVLQRARGLHGGGVVQPRLPARPQGAQALDAAALRLAAVRLPAGGRRGRGAPRRDGHRREAGEAAGGWATKVRGQDALALAETVSTRLLVMAARLMAVGLPPRVACQATLVQPLTDDVPTARALQDLVDLSF